jgi:nitrite reductase/ring-hydroxylating ferredoxin subunit
MPHVQVGLLSEFREGDPRIVCVDGREIALVLWRHEIYAIRNVCPHQSVSLAAGVVSESLTRGVGPFDFTVDEREPVVACPRHRWRFRLRDGTCEADSKARVKTYRVEIDAAGKVFLDLERPRDSVGDRAEVR